MEVHGIRHIGVLLLLLLSALSCQKETAEGTSRLKTSLLDISVGMKEESRSVISGTGMDVTDMTYGIILCEHENVTNSYRVYDWDDACLYGNIQAWFGRYDSKGTGWWYSYEHTASRRFNLLNIFTNKASVHADLYAYAPWKSGLTVQSGYNYDLTSVSESSLPDLMYATYGNPATNLDLAIGSGTIPVTVNFHHALSRIVCHFKLADAQDAGLDGTHALRLCQITLMCKNAASTPLYTSGTMNILTGAVVTTQSPQSQQKVMYAAANSGDIGAYDIYKSDSWSGGFNMLVHPTTYLSDGDFSLKFFFNGVTSDYQLVRAYDITRRDLLHSDGITCGFQPGYCYHFYFIIDNYIHLSNVVTAQWTDNNQDDILV